MTSATFSGLHVIATNPKGQSKRNEHRNGILLDKHATPDGDIYEHSTMLSPVTLRIFPSCYDCLSWSDDGELAVAAGEYVHILVCDPGMRYQGGPRTCLILARIQTPRNAAEREAGDTRTAGGQWHFSRFRTNLFTASEWPVIYPQDRQTFSIGAEQSNSTVVGLNWSPPGLGRHRRCILSVLTSNLMLSFYEPAGPGKWTRVAIVNDALKSYFEPLVQEEGPRLRKSTIRGYSWCPPIKAPRSDKASTPYSVPDAETRWGVQLLAVTNDDNEVILLRTQRLKLNHNPTSSYVFKLLSMTALGDLAGNYPMIHPGSVFSTALKSQIKAPYLSCGPWLFQTFETQPDSYSVTSNVAVLYGTKVKVIRLDAALTHENDTIESETIHKATANATELAALPGICHDRHFKGPFQWLYTVGIETIALTFHLLSFRKDPKRYCSLLVSSAGLLSCQFPLFDI